MIQRFLTTILLMLCTSIFALGQNKITGIIVDADDEYAIPYASVSYKGHHVAVSCDGEGRFTIDLHEGWVLTFSAVGYESQRDEEIARSHHQIASRSLLKKEQSGSRTHA